jgi:hypothetical protein
MISLNQPHSIAVGQQIPLPHLAFHDEPHGAAQSMKGYQAMTIRSKLASLALLAAVGMTAVAGNATAASRDGLDRRVIVTNNSNYTITNFYGSYRDTDSWEKDILGRDVLYPGESILVDFTDGTGYCIFDMRAVYEGGYENVLWHVNVCEESSVTF